MKKLFLIFLVLALLFSTSKSLNSAWRWECESGYCQKKTITPETEATALSLDACRLQCSNVAALWPKPTGEVQIGTTLFQINIGNIEVLGVQPGTSIFNATELFQENVKNLIPKQNRKVEISGGRSLVIDLQIEDNDIDQLTLDTDESYTLQISESSTDSLRAVINASNFFGARHGLETLGQLIIYDDLRDQIQMLGNVSLTDKPAYPYRGILLDTSRNYINLDKIKTTINGMAASKLNRFHWHITDSHSFPYVSKSKPELSKLGAYKPHKIYTEDDISDIISYAKVRGVRVLPEFDAPAHVGEGWQNTDLVTCFNWQPWYLYCSEAPCGQFDPTKPELYNVLEELYGDLLEQFNPDIFHMGGDEVNFNCWNNTHTIIDWMTQKGWDTTETNFVKLWNYFQNQALERLYKKAGRNIPVIMWTSHLTQPEYLLDSLPKDKYIIQVWTTATDPQIANLLENGYKLILSNYDALYLDCGFASWQMDGNNWCSPYHGWQVVYENKPAVIAGARKDQILGNEAALWSEQVDSQAIDSRLWPRAAAMAEVLWSEPTTNWTYAEQRILVHRERLVNRGIQSDKLEPEWCLQNEENCPVIKV